MPDLSWVVVAGVGTVALALPFTAPFILPALGFSAAGPVAGSLAAAAQSAYGGVVVAGGIFASLQALAMARR